MADSGTYTDATMDSRRRLADAMLKQGAEYSPIAHPYQGIARLANALFGGMGVNNLKNEAEEKDKGYSETLLKSLDAAGGTTSAIPATAPATSAPNDKSVPASIRTNNPGAMWPGPSSAKFGSTEAIDLAGGNKAAVFKSPEDGAAAQFDLLNRRYAGKTLTDAINEWSGGNNVETYVGAVSAATGIKPDEPITPELLRSPRGIQLVKAMAQHEAGRSGAIDDETWARAQGRAFAQTPNSPAQGVPAQGQQPTQNPQTPASGQNPGVGTLPVVNPQVRAQIGALVASSDHRARSMGARLIEKIVGGIAKPGTVEFGKQGAIFEGQDGRFYSMQFANNGQTLVRPVEAPGADGTKMPLTPAKGVKQVGDEIVDQATGATRRNVAGAIAGKEAAEEAGKAKGKAQSDLPRVEQNVKTFLRELEDIENDPKLPNVIGPMDARTPNVFSQGIQSRIDRAKGQSFVAAFESLKGGGQITDVEGKKATDAINRLSNQLMDEAEYKVALREARREVEDLLELVRTRARGGGAAASGAPAAAPAAGGYKVLGVR